MKKPVDYLKRHPVSISAYLLYGIMWCYIIATYFSLRDLQTGIEPIGLSIGNAYIAFYTTLLATIPFFITMVLNAILRKEDKAFYWMMTPLVSLPFLFFYFLCR